MVRVFVLEQRPVIDQGFDRTFAQAHGERDPLADRHIAGHRADRFPILPMPAEQQAAAVGLEGDFVAGEFVGSQARLRDFDDQARVARFLVGKENIDRCLAGSHGRLIGDQLGAFAGAGLQLAVLDFPRAAEGRKAGRRQGGGRLLKAFTEHHLAIDPAVDLVVHVFDARAERVGRDRADDLVGMDVENGLGLGRSARSNMTGQCAGDHN